MARKTNPIRRYHDSFRGDTYDACARCGGKCERLKTSTLVPGEAAYLAAHLGISVAELRRSCLDVIDTPYGRVDVIKLQSRCPFLGADNRCSVIEAKPVLCDCYPIIVSRSRGRTRFAIDRRDCPMARWKRYEGCIEEFVSRGIPALRRLGLGPAWLAIVGLYDEFDFDYGRIEVELSLPSRRGAVMLEELLAFACGGYEREARERGLRLLAARARLALGERARDIRRRIREARRDGALLSEQDGARYRELVLEVASSIRRLRRGAVSRGSGASAPSRRGSE